MAKIPTKRQLADDALYTVLSERQSDGAIYVSYVGTDHIRARELAAQSRGVVIKGQIHHDAR